MHKGCASVNVGGGGDGGVGIINMAFVLLVVVVGLETVWPILVSTATGELPKIDANLIGWFSKNALLEFRERMEGTYLLSAIIRDMFL